MLNVLITGSSGFIGNHLKNHLNGKYNLILPSREDLSSDSLLGNIDIVIHLAGKAHDIAGITHAKDYSIYNTYLTNGLFDRFLISNSTVFIFMSSILVLSPNSSVPLTEEMTPAPVTNYAKSKYESELHISNSRLPLGKRYYILRTPLIYGTRNKGNFMLLFDFIKKIPFWPLGRYHSERSFCDIRNLSFVINNLIENQEVESGIYHVADNDVYDLNELYSSITRFWGKTPRIIALPKSVIRFLFSMGTFLKLSFNLNQLNKLTTSLLVSNHKIKKAIKSDLPLGGLDDLINCQKSLH